jgi:hypothetical protein
MAFDRGKAGVSRRAVAFADVPALRRAAVAVAGALILATCAPSGSERDERQLKSAAAATATAQMALTAWLANGAPAAYARRTVKAMRQKLAAAADEISASDSAAAAQRAITLAPMRQSGAALERAEQAIVAGDRVGAERAGGEAATVASNFTAPAPVSRPSPR